MADDCFWVCDGLGENQIKIQEEKRGSRKTTTGGATQLNLTKFGIGIAMRCDAITRIKKNTHFCCRRCGAAEEIGCACDKRNQNERREVKNVEDRRSGILGLPCSVNENR